MRRFVRGAVLCLAVGCASLPIEEEAEEAEGGVSPVFTGMWSGTFTTTPPGSGRQVKAGALTLRAYGEVLEVSGLCQDGTGEATAGGEGRALHWAGLVTCPMPSDSCSEATLRYYAGTFRLTGRGVEATLSAELYGGARGCDAGEDVTVTFHGRR